MSFKHRLYVIATLIFFCNIAIQAQAGTLFPPANIGANPNVACPNSQVLAWTGESVVCVNPTPGVTVSCPAGTVLADITNGNPNCMPVPACQAGQTLNFNGTTFVCTASAIPTCAAGQVITFNGTSFVCVNQDPTVPTCAAGQFLTYNGVAFQCSGTQSVAIPTCGAGQFVTSNGTSFSCATLPASDGVLNGTWCGFFDSGTDPLTGDALVGVVVQCGNAAPVQQVDIDITTGGFAGLCPTGYSPRNMAGDLNGQQGGTGMLTCVKN